MTGAYPGFSKGGGGGGGAQSTNFLGGSRDMPPQKVLKIRVSKMAISSILRQISYSFNTSFC